MYTSTTTSPISDKVKMATVRTMAKNAESNEVYDHSPIISLKDSSHQ